MSTLRVDSIKRLGAASSDSDSITIAGDGNVTVKGLDTGQVLEIISGLCDGRTVQGKNGTFTLPNAGNYWQSTSTTYQDIPGSSFSYTPPTGTKTVIYDWTVDFGDRGYGGISHYKFFIDSTEVTLARRTLSFSYESGNNQHGQLTIPFKYTINIGTDDVPNGKVGTWTSDKTMKIMMRNYSGSYMTEFHHNTWWDGSGASGTNKYSVPILTVTAMK